MKYYKLWSLLGATVLSLGALAAFIYTDSKESVKTDATFRIYAEVPVICRAEHKVLSSDSLVTSLEVKELCNTAKGYTAEIMILGVNSALIRTDDGLQTRGVSFIRDENKPRSITRRYYFYEIDPNWVTPKFKVVMTPKGVD